MSARVYIYGSTGLLGPMLVQELEKDPSIDTITTSIRARKGLSAEERFQKLYGGTRVRLSNTIPSDTTHVILNGFPTSWHMDVKRKVKQGVVPIIRYLKECENLEDLKNVTFTSSAYIQPPAPYPETSGLIEFVGSENPMKFYQDILDGRETMESLQKKSKEHGFHPHTTLNAYYVAKNLTEHILVKNFSHLPFTITRPAGINACTRGLHGTLNSSPMMLTAKTALDGIALHHFSGGIWDAAPVDTMAKVFVQYALASPTKSVIFLTSKFMSPQELLCDRLQLPVKFYDSEDPSETRLCMLYRKAEMEKLSARQRKLADAVYSLYDYYTIRVWNFPTTIPVNKDVAVQSILTFIQSANQKEQQRAKKAKL